MTCIRYFLESVGPASAAGSFTDGPFTFTVEDPVGTAIAREIRAFELPGLRAGRLCEVSVQAGDAPVDLLLRNGTDWKVTGYGSPGIPVVLAGASSKLPRLLRISVPGLYRIVIESDNETDILEICRCN